MLRPWAAAAASAPGCLQDKASTIVNFCTEYHHLPSELLTAVKLSKQPAS
jgi:hypothetical protein